MDCRTQRRRAAFYEFGIGLPVNVILAAVLYWGLPCPDGLTSPGERVIYALQCNALPAVVLLFALWAVAIGRATSAAIDPLAGKESRTLTVHLKFLSGTLEQVVLFSISSLALSVFLEPCTMPMIPIAAILFVLNRIVFWLGYLRHSTLRALGLAGTIYPVSVMVLYAAYCSIGMLVGIR